MEYLLVAWLLAVDGYHFDGPESFDSLAECNATGQSYVEQGVVGAWRCIEFVKL